MLRVLLYILIFKVEKVEFLQMKYMDYTIKYREHRIYLV